MMEQADTELIADLWKQSAPERRCPHVRFTGRRCRCAAVAEELAESACDHFSLQLWCLAGERYPSCIFYPKDDQSDSGNK